MNLFDNETGHFTEEGLDSLIAGNLDELQSLEAAEHLSFCDSCCGRYAALLTDDVLLQPEHPVTEPVMQRIQKRRNTIFFNRGLKVGLAACLALGLWLTGVFSAVSTPLQQGEFDRSSYLLKQEQTRSATAKEEMKNKYLADGEQEATTLNMQISDAVESFFASFTQKGETDK